jgi:phosphoenolpyruvate synthase/pyruvate phosphate dikinase
MKTELVYPFTTDETPELAQVGGKAMSLILMTQRGLPVPPGFVLSVAFFEPWLAAIQSTPEWTRTLNSFPQDLKRNTMMLETLCLDLELDRERRATLAQAVEYLRADGGAPLFAVRSSSPEEDLEELSFAGGYETTLGVTKEALEGALRRSFASCFDERVFAYKKEHGLAVDQPRIAVIVQQQIAAEAAGVAFSLNPLNNCYDEAVINANFGLGESVVSGVVSPDLFVVDKISRTILEREVGKKETSVWLDSDRGGGTFKEPSPSRSQLCLSDENVLALTDMLVAVEDDFGKPMDVEWAFVGGNLVLLQARPITAHFPLPEPLLTAPGEPKLLYADLTLVKWGMQEPLSVMGTDYLEIMNSETLKFTMGEDIGPDAVNATRRTVEGRTYVVLSNSLKMQGKKRVASEFREMDALTAESVANIDEAEYVPRKLPPALKGIAFKMIRQNLGLGWHVLQGLKNPAQCRQRYVDEEEQLARNLALMAQGADELSTKELSTGMMVRMIDYTRTFMPALFVAMIARSRIKKLFKDDDAKVQEKVAYLERALPNNVTIEMGLAMYRLASFEEIKTCPSGEVFASRIGERAFSAEFLRAWDTFMETYGFRSPMEMDPAASRFYERPVQFFQQLKTLGENTDPAANPQAIYDTAKAEREEAYEALLQVAQNKGKRKARQFAKDYATWVDLGGFRESPKYYLVLIMDMFRRRVLELARTLVDAGRLDTPEQVFDLHMDDLDRGLADPSFDLRALAEENTRFLRRLRQVRELPRVVDSRGKIIRPPRRQASEGELVGEPISTGTIQGPVKVLHTPYEKPVLPGEILVARTTDPGWTPLFINAGGIILEVGGKLQHGALVAREYGKPCVSGIEDAVDTFTDGQVVEVDGLNGIVRLV